jgi:hypothetical protein
VRQDVDEVEHDREEANVRPASHDALQLGGIVGTEDLGIVGYVRAISSGNNPAKSALRA